MSSIPGRSETIPVSVTPEAAEFFRSLPEERRRLIELLFARTLDDARKRPKKSLLDLARKASKQAKERGLTEEKLRQILDEE